ncbi:photosystem II reaction center W protein, chloroplastic-like [Fagus crenata]
MAAITSTNFANLLPRTCYELKGSSRIHSSSILGMPRMVTRGRVRCSVGEKASLASGKGSMSNTSMVASLMAVTSVVTTTAGPAMALVDERMSTEGTGLPFGLSNNLLGWILLGVFGLIWTLYFIYASTLEEDDDSGLSL